MAFGFMIPFIKEERWIHEIYTDFWDFSVVDAVCINGGKYI